MTTIDQLQQIFKDNFVAYFRSHVAHFNIMGRTFAQDHEFLKGIYEELQDQVDILGELIRSLDDLVESSLTAVVDQSTILPELISQTDADGLLEEVQADLSVLKRQYQDLIAIADQEGLLEISNYAQERVLALAKHIWMFRSTLN